MPNNHNTAITTLEERALSLSERAKTIKVTDKESFIAANEFRYGIRDLRMQISEAWDPVIDSTNKAHRQALEQKKRCEGPLIQADNIVKAEMGRYMADEEQVHREAEEKARRAREEAERKRLETLRAAAAAEKEGKSEETDRILEQIPEKPKAIIPEPVKIKGTFLRRDLRWRVVDLAAVPRDYLCVDRAKVEEVFRRLGKAMAIPGIETYEETTIVMRGPDA